MKAKEFSVKDFLKTNMISLDEYDFERDHQAYLQEMQKGLDNESTIPMLPTFIEDCDSIPVDEPVLVLDAGGTNFRAAIVRFNAENEAEISSFRKTGMPGVEREYGREEFFDTIAGFVVDLAAEVDKIGFCFSYPMEKTIEKDGRLICFSKEIKAPEVVGQLIGQGVLEALKRQGVTNIRQIVLLNDTVATLLAGKASGGPDEFDAYIGLILGTGINASYNEKNVNIGKLDNLPDDGSQLINMETGSCSIMPSGPLDQAFRNTTARPETYVFEKMISGGYLGALWFFILGRAAEDGCFSVDFGKALADALESGASAGYDTSDLSRFLADKTFPEELSSSASVQDTERAFEISRAITERAAYLASVLAASIVIKTGKGLHPDKPVCICVDGSTFWKLTGLRALIESDLKKYLTKAGVHFRITGIDNAPIIGAAVAGLTNA